MPKSTELGVLNLGCGNKILDAINHDLYKHRPEVDVAWDLNALPWPWENSQFQCVWALSVLEHLDIDLLTAMNEVWRIVTPGGLAVVKLPYWGVAISYADPTHRRVFDPQVFDTLDPSTERGQAYGFYTPFKWKVERREFVNEERTSFVAHLRKLVT